MFAAILVALTASTVVLVRSSETAREQQEAAQWWRAHTLGVLIGAEQMDTALNRALRGERGFVLTRHSKSFATYRQGLADYARFARQVREATRDNALQQRSLSELDRRVVAFARLSGHVMDRVQAGDEAGALVAVRTGREREAIENASLTLDAIKAEERRLLAAREAANAQVMKRSARSARIVIGLTAMLLAVVAATIAAMLRARAGAARATEAVKASERLYRLLAEHSNDLIVCIGLDGVRRYVSPASQTLLGYAPEEMVGGAPATDIHVEDRARTFEACRSLLDGVENPVCSYRQRHRDGHYVWLEASYRLIRDATGAPVEVVASVRDISRRHAVEIKAAEALARLDDNNRLFAMAASIARIGHWRVDLIRDAVTWSDEVYRINEVGADFALSLDSAIARYHPEDRDRIGHILDEAILTGEPYEFSAQLLLPSGVAKAVAVQGQVERAPGGDIVGVFGVIQDVSAQLAAQEALRRSEQAFRLLADNATDVVLRTDDAGAPTYVSPSWLGLTGFTAEELVARACADFVHPDDYPVVRAAHVAIITGAQTAMTIQYRLDHKGQGWCWVEAIMKLWRTAQGTDGGVITAIRDIGKA